MSEMSADEALLQVMSYADFAQEMYPEAMAAIREAFAQGAALDALVEAAWGCPPDPEWTCPEECPSERDCHACWRDWGAKVVEEAKSDDR